MRHRLFHSLLVHPNTCRKGYARGVSVENDENSHGPYDPLAKIPWGCGVRQSSRIIMTSSNGNIFRVTGNLCGEFTGHRKKADDAELWYFLWSGWVNNGEAGDLRRHLAHYGVTVMSAGHTHVTPCLIRPDSSTATRLRLFISLSAPNTQLT